MQTTPSRSERTTNTEAPDSVPLSSSTSSPIIADSDNEPSANENQPSPVFNENNKRPRVASPVIATASILPQASNPPILGSAISTTGSLATAIPISPAVIEGAQPKRAMSEEHLSSRGESPVVNLSNGQPNAITSGTKLSEVTYPTEGTEAVDTEMKSVDSAETGMKQNSRATTGTEPALPARNQGLAPNNRPPLKEQVAAIRGMSIINGLDSADMTACSNCSCHQH